MKNSYHKDYFKNYYLKNKIKIMAQRALTRIICEVCGIEFGMRRCKQRFCGKQCQGKYYQGLGNKDHYIKINKPNHPHCDKNGQVRQHRLVMEEKIGRFLDPKEVVHHKNHNKRDNRIENLELLKSSSVHRKLHYPELSKKLNSKEAKAKMWRTRKKLYANNNGFKRANGSRVQSRRKC